MPKGTKKGQAEAAVLRRQQMFQLRCAGASFEQIGRQFGVSSTVAFKLVQRVLSDIKETEKQDLAEMRAVENERIDLAARSIAGKVREGSLGAIDRWIKLLERRAKLNGLDAAVKQEVTGADGAPLYKVYAGFDPEDV